MRVIPWSQVQGTELALHARLIIWDNADHRELTYHNWDHVESMYQYLADTNEPYDEALDWAVLFHDIVYDEKPEKEYRSMKVFADMVERYEGCTPDIWERDRVCKLIIYTVDHVVTQYPKSSAIVRADLHGLTKPLTTIQNFVNIMKESTALYGIDETEFARNSEKFMNELFWRVHRNAIYDVEHQQFYHDACKGVLTTINLAQILQGTLK
jgi:predicted metal-dependent HD superfamily phosphohydrolase